VRDERWLEWGRAAERYVRRALSKQGRWVVPPGSLDGGAPMLVGAMHREISPDLWLLDGMVSFAEVKLKHHCDVYRKGLIVCESVNAPAMQWQQGIDLPNWCAYCEVERVTDKPGEIYMLQLLPGANAEADPVLLWQSIAELVKHVQIKHTPHVRFPHGAAYFPMGCWKCRRVGDFFAAPGFFEQPRGEQPWQRKSKTGAAPAWKITTCKESPFQQRSRVIAVAEEQHGQQA
jgi:hypothetical protein